MGPKERLRAVSPDQPTVAAPTPPAWSPATGLGTVSRGTTPTPTTPQWQDRPSSGLGAVSQGSTPARRRSNRLRGPAALLAPLGLGLVLLLGWFALTAPGQISPHLLPGPGPVWDRLVEGLITRGSLWPYLRVTFLEAALGCGAGTVVALPLAVVITHSRWAAAAVTPFLGATQAIPAIALAPLLVVWIGYGRSPVVALCALMVFFPILVSAVVGLRHLDSDVLDAAAMDGAGFWARLGLIEFPLAGASIMAGLRNGFTLSVTGAVVGEMVMGGSGLGMLLTVQRDNNNMSGMIATIVVLAVLASTIYSLISLIERRVFVSEGYRR